MPVKKKILVLCPYPEQVAPSQRLKFEQYYPYFREAGYEVVVSPYISPAFWKIIYQKGNFLRKAGYAFAGYLRRLRDLFRLRRYDVVYVHLWVTPFGPPVFEWLVKLFAKKIIYDIDDLVYLKNTSSRSNPLVRLIKGAAKPLKMMQLADHVITCTPYLDQFVRKYNPHTTDISSTINTELYRPKQDYALRDGKAILGWSGSHSTSAYLYLLEPVFHQLQAEGYAFRLLVMGDPHFHINGIETEAIAWKESWEVDTIGRFDIGLYPLPDEEWVLGKSGLKALQYMAAGVPAVATAIGANFRIISNGVNGLLAASQDEWLQHLRTLISDEAFRRKIGEAGAKQVEQHFSIHANKGTYLEILEQVIDNG